MNDSLLANKIVSMMPVLINKMT